MYVDVYALGSFCSSRFPCPQFISPHVSYPHPPILILLLFFLIPTWHSPFSSIIYIFSFAMVFLYSLQVQVLRQGKGVCGRRIVWTQDEFHISGCPPNSLSHLYLQFKKKHELTALTSRKKKISAQLLHKKSFKPKTKLSILLTWLNIRQGISCPYKSEEW